MYRGKPGLSFVKLLLSWWYNQTPKHRTWQGEDRLTDSCFLPSLLTFNILAFSKNFTEVHEKAIARLKTGCLKRDMQLSIPPPLFHLIYQSHLAIQQTGKRNSLNKSEQGFKYIFHFLGSNKPTLVCSPAKVKPQKA